MKKREISINNKKIIRLSIIITIILISIITIYFIIFNLNNFLGKKIFFAGLCNQSNQETLFTNVNGNQSHPRIDGNKAVWRDTRNGIDGDIYLYDFSTCQEIIITNDNYYQSNPVISGDIIVWEDRRSSPDIPPPGVASDIYMFDLSTGIESPVVTAPLGQTNPAIYGNIIVWQDIRSKWSNIYYYNISLGMEFQVTEENITHSQPDVYNDKIVYIEKTNDSDFDIFMYDITTGQKTHVSFGTGDEIAPSIYGDKIVYMASGYAGYFGERDILIYDIPSSTEIALVNATRDQVNPLIHGNKIVWTDYREGELCDEITCYTTKNVFMYDLSTNTETQITFVVSTRWNPDISGNRIVYEGPADIFYYYIDNEQISTCGNGIVQGNEECDLGNSNSDLGTCSTRCTLTFCGDGIIQNPNGYSINEICERNKLNGETCISQGFDGGLLYCLRDCLSFDTSSCLNIPPSLTITSPVNGSIVESSSVLVNYVPTGNLTNVDHIHLQLDGNSIVMDLDFDRFYTFTGVSNGSHTINAFLVDINHVKISGTDTSVTFTVSLPTQSCSDKNGDICTINEFCSGNLISANDSNSCCDTSCQSLCPTYTLDELPECISVSCHAGDLSFSYNHSVCDDSELCTSERCTRVGCEYSINTSNNQCITSSENCIDSDNDDYLDFNAISCPIGLDRCIEDLDNFTAQLLNSLYPIGNYLNISFNAGGDPRNLSNSKISRGKIAEIEFKDKLKLLRTNRTGCFAPIHIDTLAEIRDKKVNIHSEDYPSISKSARIKMFNVTFANPMIRRDGVDCNEPDCTIVEYNRTGRYLVFDVTGFSEYEVVEVGTRINEEGGEERRGGSGGSGVVPSSDLSATECISNWYCGEWSRCVDNKQTRICKDLNNCGTTQGRLSSEKTCDKAEEAKEITEREIAKLERSLKEYWPIFPFFIFIIIGIIVTIILIIRSYNKKLLSKRKKINQQELEGKISNLMV